MAVSATAGATSIDPIVPFNYGSAVLPDRAEPHLKGLADETSWVGSNFCALMVVGYTGPRGGEENNRRLLKERGDAIAKDLIARGLPIKQIDKLESDEQTHNNMYVHAQVFCAVTP